MSSALFWDFTRPTVVIPYRRFGTTYRSPSSMDRTPKKTLEGATDRLYRNVGEKLMFV